MAIKIILSKRYERFWEITTTIENENFEVKRSGASSQFIFFTFENMAYEVRITGDCVEAQLVQTNDPFAAGKKDFDRYTAVYINSAPLGMPNKVNETKSLTLNGVEIIKVKRKR